MKIIAWEYLTRWQLLALITISLSKSLMNKYFYLPQYILDLHGYTREEAHKALDGLLRQGKYSRVRIIVGKGLHSKRKPVLAKYVKRYLNERNIRFNQSKIEHGGEGALEVFFEI